MAEVSWSASVWKWTHLWLNIVLTPLTGVRHCLPESHLYKAAIQTNTSGQICGPLQEQVTYLEIFLRT